MAADNEKAAAEKREEKMAAAIKGAQKENEDLKQKLEKSRTDCAIAERKAAESELEMKDAVVQAAAAKREATRREEEAKAALARKEALANVDAAEEITAVKKDALERVLRAEEASVSACSVRLACSTYSGTAQTSSVRGAMTCL